MPLCCEQVTAGLNPENENARSFRECVIVRHPRHGEYAFGFITGETVLQVMKSPVNDLPAYVRYFDELTISIVDCPRT